MGSSYKIKKLVFIYHIYYYIALYLNTYMTRVHLNIEERNIVRSICRVQVKALLSVYAKRTYKQDMEVLQQEGEKISEFDFIDSIQEMIHNYTTIRKKPEQFLHYLQEDCMLVGFKHVLAERDEVNNKSVRAIWRKVLLFEDLLITQN